MKKYIALLLLFAATPNAAFAQSMPQTSVEQIMRWDAENLAFDALARRHFKLIENNIDGRVAKLTFKSADQTCIVTLGYVGELPSKDKQPSRPELPKGWMLSGYQCSMNQGRPAN